MVAILLLLTILYCVRLNNSIKRLKGDETALRTTIAELVAATETAERAIAGLKATVRESDQTLGERLRAAERFLNEMNRHIEAGQGILNRLLPIAPAQPPAPEKPAAKPVAPDPKDIVAAARALAERARARANGVAA